MPPSFQLPESKLVTEQEKMNTFSIHSDFSLLSEMLVSLFASQVL